jgi:hypothetical protein
MPYEKVLEMLKICMATAYEPNYLYERFAYNVQNTYANRIPISDNSARITWSNIQRALSIMGNLILRLGLFSSYRKVFWKMVIQCLEKGDIESMIHIALVAHHLIQFTAEFVEGQETASFYSQKRNVLAQNIN